MDDSIVTPTYNKIAQKYTDKYFDDIADIDEVNKFISHLPQNARVLDCGSGPGNWTKYLIEKGFDAQGIDTSSEMIKIAAEKVPNAKFSLMDIRKLDFPDSSFDGIMAMYSLIHIPSAQIPTVLGEFSRILANNGVLFITAQKGEEDHIVTEPFDPNEKIFINFFTSERLQKYLEDAGFKIISQKEEFF